MNQLLFMYLLCWAFDWVWLIVLVSSGAFSPTYGGLEAKKRARRRIRFYFFLPFTWPWYIVKWTYRIVKHFFKNLVEIFRDPPPPAPREEYPRRK